MAEATERPFVHASQQRRARDEGDGVMSLPSVRPSASVPGGHVRVT